MRYRPTYPGEIFHGKIPSGRAVLMSMDHLRRIHYPKHHRPVSEGSLLAQRIYQVISFDPTTTGVLREELGMKQRPERAKFDRALQELQTTVNITRRNSLEDENDTWVPLANSILTSAEPARVESTHQSANEYPCGLLCWAFRLSV